MGKAAIDAAGNLGELAAQAGVTTRQLQGLELAAVGVGVSQQQLVTSLSQFGVRVGEAAAGTGELKDTLDRYGIAVRDTSGHVRGSVEVLGDLADAVQGAASEQEKLSIVADAFGSRVGPKLLPLLTEGAEGFQKWAQTAEAAGLVMDDKLIAAADRASDSIATLKFAVAKGFEIGIVREFAGAVSVTADNLKAAREAGEAFGRMVGTTMKLGIDAIKSLQPFLGTTAREFRAIFDIVKRLFEFTVTPFAFADEAKKADDAIGPLVVDIHKAVEPTKALAKATGELARISHSE